MVRSYRKNHERNANSSKNKRNLTNLTVRSRPGHPTQGLLVAGTAVFPCALGHGGITANKREGDGATPLGSMRLLSGFFRGDHIPVRSTRLPMKRIGPDLGWCEVPDDRNYNRPVRIPYGASHETMQRADRLYDYCLVLDWNISARKRGRGSAIFFHLARAGFTPTQGCVAVTEKVMARLLPFLTSRTVVTVKR